MQATKLQGSELNALQNREYQSADGMKISPMDSHWRLTMTSNKVVTPELAERVFAEDVRPYFRLALVRFAASRKTDSVYNVSAYLSMAFTRHGGDFNILDERDFLSAKVRAGVKREYQLSTIRGFFKFWHKSGLYGVSDEFIGSIYKLTFKGNEKGEAVRSRDPLRGPYTQLEMEALNDGLTNAFMESRVSLEEWVIFKLYFERGLRRVQMAQLAFQDFTKEADAYFIDQPRSKQRADSFRESLSRYSVSGDLYAATQLLKAQRVQEINGLASANIANGLSLMPLFPRHETLVLCAQRGTPIEAQCFQPREGLDAPIRRLERGINAFSERTGERIKLTSRRFRSTLGTDLNREGAGVGVIAVALDHEDEQNAGVYVESTGDNATRLNHKIGKLLAPLAQAFAGMIVRDESVAERANDPTSRIRVIDGTENIGSCGNYEFCNANAPVACYTCIKFQPWLDAPHEDVLIELYRERERTLSVTGDETMARILDRSILAVEDVIQRCEAIKRKGTANE
jgi:integrase